MGERTANCGSIPGSTLYSMGSEAWLPIFDCSFYYSGQFLELTQHHHSNSGLSMFNTELFALLLSLHLKDVAIFDWACRCSMARGKRPQMTAILLGWIRPRCLCRLGVSVVGGICGAVKSGLASTLPPHKFTQSLLHVICSICIFLGWSSPINTAILGLASTMIKINY